MHFPNGIYLFKVNNGNIRTMSEIALQKDTSKISMTARYKLHISTLAKKICFVVLCTYCSVSIRSNGLNPQSLT